MDVDNPISLTFADILEYIKGFISVKVFAVALLLAALLFLFILLPYTKFHIFTDQLNFLWDTQNNMPGHSTKKFRVTVLTALALALIKG